MFEIKPYTNNDSIIWNEFVKKSKNGTFLFNRDYMDYHRDRYEDASLLIYRKNKLYALLPANINRDEKTVYSHQGLTYGGFVLSLQVTINELLIVFEMVLNHYKDIGCSKMIYKSIPYIYSQYPSQEDLYALFRFNAKIIGRNISSTILSATRIPFPESRKSGVRKAIRNEVQIQTSEEFHLFWKILNENLTSKYDTKSVHSVDEISLLRNKFPGNIKHHVALCQNKVVAGVVMYLTPTTAHVQYISANNDGKNIGALDLLFFHLIEEEYSNFQYFDFGQSTEQMGNYLNEHLIFQKEGFGGRGVAYDVYGLNLTS